MPEKILTEDDLRAFAEKAVSEKLRNHSKALLSQMSEIRSNGGSPICVLNDEGWVQVKDDANA